MPADSRESETVILDRIGPGSSMEQVQAAAGGIVKGMQVRPRTFVPSDEDSQLWHRVVEPPAPGDLTDRGRRAGYVKLLSFLSLVAVLSVQDYLSIRISSANTAYLSEAADLYLGHQEIAHLLHGAAIPAYQTYSSGAPTLYPVLGAAVDHFAGLAGARLLSTGLMLATTTALYLTARRMHGERAGFFTAALFAILGPTVFLGAYSTFDPLSLCLLAWSAYFAVRFAFADRRSALILSTALMALADCTEYVNVLWAPVVIGLAALSGPGNTGWRDSRRWNAQRFTLLWATVLLLFIMAGRDSYFRGFVRTALTRTSAGGSVADTAADTATWVGVLLALAAGGVFIAARDRRPEQAERFEFWLALLLLGAGLLGPVSQFHSSLSLPAQVDVGIWFACIPAGYLLARIAGSVTLVDGVGPGAALLFTAAAVLPLGLAGAHQARAMTGGWPNSTQLVATLKPYVHQGRGEYLVEDYDVPAYYLSAESTWQQWHDLKSAQYTVPGTGQRLNGVPALRAAITAHKYSLIVLDYSQTPQTDVAVRSAVIASGYRLIAIISMGNGAAAHGDYYIWVLP